MEELRRNRRLTSAHKQLSTVQATRIGEIHTAIAACDQARERAMGKIEMFGNSQLFNPSSISRALRDLSDKRVKLEKDLAAAELEQAKLEIIIERLRETQLELEQVAFEEEMAESIEEWTNRDLGDVEIPRRNARR
ncbi:hypothetical protein [Aestuariivirga litoralis]|uniref:hypothetical protein n=1 Tax=Aestuariivirga litoralis TaxID=2650924 RepID=UPI0018C55076|nr:hypothetical protein [Aestuariivirga litoralis]MBG1233172.1 hypothetical protein [Aestuariivirga litoralis]